jgi:hypothetical protein
MLLLPVVGWWLIAHICALVHWVEAGCVSVAWLLHIAFSHAVLLLRLLDVVRLHGLLIVLIHRAGIRTYTTAGRLSSVVDGARCPLKSIWRGVSLGG